jgi:hypothetical protein
MRNEKLITGTIKPQKPCSRVNYCTIRHLIYFSFLRHLEKIGSMAGRMPTLLLEKIGSMAGRMPTLLYFMEMSIVLGILNA